MRRFRAPRTVLTAALACAALTVGLSGAAHADTALPTLSLQATTAALPPAPQTVDIAPGWQSDAGQVNIDDAVIQYDFGAVAGFAQVNFTGDCSVTGTVATCQEYLFGQSDSPVDITLAALPDAPVGATGSIQVSGSSAEAVIAPGSVAVTVGGPRFALEPLKDRAHLTPGTTVNEPVVFGNTGNRAASGVNVVFYPTPGVILPTDHANCRYAVYTKLGRTYQGMAVCRVETALPPGSQVALDPRPQVLVQPDLLKAYLDVDVLPLGYDAPELQYPQDGTWVQGTGPDLGVKVLHAGTPDAAPPGTLPLPPADSGPGNYQVATLTSDSGADFAVTGSSDRAPAGSTVTLSFTMTNHGPGTLYDRSGGEGTPWLAVTPPPGTTVVGSSANCYATPDDSFGPYRCNAPYLFYSGQTESYALTLHVDTRIRHATGTVSLHWGYEGGNPPYDPDPTDNSASLLLN